MIYEKHVVVDGFNDLFWMVTEKHRPDETVTVVWPDEVQRGIRTLGWHVEVRKVDQSHPRFPQPEPPNWLVVAETLANSLRSLMGEVDIPKPDEDDPEVTEFLALWDTARKALDVHSVSMIEASMVGHSHDFKAGSSPEDRCYVCGEKRPEVVAEDDETTGDEGANA